MPPPSRRAGLSTTVLLLGHSIKACTVSNAGLGTAEQDVTLQAPREAPRLRLPLRDGERPLALPVRASLLLSIYLLDSILSESTLEFNFLRF